MTSEFLNPTARSVKSDPIEPGFATESGMIKASAARKPSTGEVGLTRRHPQGPVVRWHIVIAQRAENPAEQDLTDGCAPHVQRGTLADGLQQVMSSTLVGVLQAVAVLLQADTVTNLAPLTVRPGSSVGLGGPNRGVTQRGVWHRSRPSAVTSSAHSSRIGRIAVLSIAAD